MTPTRAHFASQRFPLRGLTLVESVVALFIVGLMIVSALRAVGGAAKARLVQRDRVKGMALAEQLAAEIMQRRYADPGPTPIFGPETGQTRPTYDDVDDYHNLVESPPVDRLGTAVSGATGWTRSTKVEYLDAALAVSATDAGLKRITITVTSPNGRISTLVAMRLASSEYEQIPSTQTTYTTWVGLSLQVGSDQASRAASSVNLLNQVP